MNIILLVFWSKGLCSFDFFLRIHIHPERVVWFCKGRFICRFSFGSCTGWYSEIMLNHVESAEKWHRCKRCKRCKSQWLEWSNGPLSSLLLRRRSDTGEHMFRNIFTTVHNHESRVLLKLSIILYCKAKCWPRCFSCILFYHKAGISLAPKLTGLDTAYLTEWKKAKSVQMFAS